MDTAHAVAVRADTGGAEMEIATVKRGTLPMRPPLRWAWAFLFLLTLSLRLHHLDARIFHHDESIHGWFSMHLAFEGDYRYDPIYHGPVQYAMVASAFRLLGDSDFTARLPAALGGTALVALALLLRRRFGEGAALASGALLSLSPNLLYYTRFCREDVWSLLGTAGVFLFFDAWWRGGRLFSLILCALSSAVAFAAKENFYVLLALMVPTLLAVALPPGEKLQARRRFRALVVFLETHAFALAGAFLLFFIVSELLYTLLLVHPDSGNPAREAISYWWGQHKAERVGGPKWYYLPRLAQYEFAILLPALAYALRRRRALDFVDAILSAGTFSCAALYVALSFWPREAAWVTLAKGLLPFAGATLLGGLLFCRSGNAAERFLGAWGVSSLVMYAYLGEKTPWLIVHQLLPFVALAGLFWTRLASAVFASFKAGAIGSTPTPRLTRVLGFVFGTALAAASIVSALSLSFSHPVLTHGDNHVESVIYVQTAPELRGPIDEVLATALTQAPEDPLAAVVGEPTWPLSWYFRHLPVDWVAPTAGRRPAYVFTDPEKADGIAEALGDGYSRDELPLRVWWLPHLSTAPLHPTPRELLTYLTTRVPWLPPNASSPLGDQTLVVFRRTEQNPRR
ncbi:MAG: flippase activity-associated protein Agl23 [Thermoanaerobaculia bacterium]